MRMVRIYNIPSQYIIILIMITYISQVDHISSHIIVNQAISQIWHVWDHFFEAPQIGDLPIAGWFNRLTV